jgi:DNA-3-methyladenine glycosylase II
MTFFGAVMDVNFALIGTPQASSWDWQYRQLAEVDYVLAGLVDSCGMPDPFSWKDPAQPTDRERARESNFAGLVLHILAQHGSLISAYETYDRLVADLGEALTAGAVLSSSPDRMRTVGVSRQKSAFLFDLAERQSGGLIEVEKLHDLDDDEAVSALSAFNGIGRWTAEMFLIHQLDRHDILPAADIGIRRGIEHAYGLPALPTPADVRRRGEIWAPYRTFASELLWHWADGRRST